MDKLHIKRGILIGGMFSLMLGNVMAKDIPAKVAETSETNSSSVVLGRLFNTEKDNSTAAVSTVSSELLYKNTTPNITNTLFGYLPGLTVKQGSGIPGDDNASLMIRGVGSYGFGGYNVCKYFVDGFEVNQNYLNYLTPAEIESVSILKDAASLATFGMRGANGVVWIETKRGKIGKATIKVQLRKGLQSAVNINKPMNSYDYGTYYNQAISNDNGAWTPKYSVGDLAAYKDGTGVNVDWYDEVLKKSAQYLDGDITFNGGNTNARYNVVFGYANQGGLYNVANTDQTSNLNFQKYNLRANLDFDMLKIFEAKVDIGGRIEERVRPNYSTSGLMNDLANYPSNIYNVMDDSINYSGTSIYKNNPVGSIKGLGWASEHSRILQGNFTLKEKLDFLLKGLYMKEAFSFNSYTRSTYNKTRNYARYYNGVKTTTDETTTIVASGYGSGGMEDWKQGDITLGWDGETEKSVIKSALNFHTSDYKGDGYFGYKYHYLNFNGKVNYSYDKRYVADLAFSYFGSDSYAKGNRWGFYPTVSGAWIASNEEFLKSSSVVDYLKIRASVGTTGGTDSGETGNLSSFSSNGRFLYKQYFTSSYVGSFYTNNSTPAWQTTLVPMFVANKDAFAEKSLKYNIGAELTLFKKLEVTADAFMDKRSGILTLDNSLMGYYGYNFSLANIGKMTNKGFELTVSYADKMGKLGYNLSAMASYNKNKIDYCAEVAKAYDYNAVTGRAFGSTIGLVADGFYQITDFDANGNLNDGLAVPAFGKVQPGDIKYKNLNPNDDNIIDQNDVTQVGKSGFPEWTYSFRAGVDYAGLDLSVMLQGTAGSSVNLLDNGSQVVAYVNNANAYEIAKGAWAYYPDQNIDTRYSATYPRLTTKANTNNYRTSSFWMKSGDYLRIRNIELGYSFGNDILEGLGLTKLRVYVNATNPLTLSSLLKDYNIDPEVMSGYPALKSYNAGITLAF